jgi:WD40 repeat protein
MGKPVELFYHTQSDRINDFRSSRIRPQNQMRQAELLPPSEGLRTQAVTMNSTRNQIVAAYRDDSPDGSKPRHTLVLYRIKTVTEFDLDVIAESANPHTGAVSAVAFARDGKTLATGGEDGSVCLWDVKNVGLFWKPRATVKATDARVVAVAFSPDWRMVAAITWDKTKPNVLFIDADSGTLVRSARLDRELTAVAWSPDGRTLLTGGYSGKVCAWDVDGLLKGQ